MQKLLFLTLGLSIGIYSALIYANTVLISEEQKLISSCEETGLYILNGKYIECEVLK